MVFTRFVSFLFKNPALVRQGGVFCFAVQLTVDLSTLLQDAAAFCVIVDAI